MTPGKMIIGIDGGGSTCRFAIVACGRRTDLTRGPANVTTDRDAALTTVAEGLRDLVALAGLDADALAEARLHAGLAGVMSRKDADDVAAALPVSMAKVTDDRPTTMRGALGPADGTVAAIGTGSFFGRQSEGRQSFVGGWGSRLGDEASGAWLGQKLLSAALHAEDGLRPKTPLTAAVLKRLGGPARIVAFANTATPAEVAAFASDMMTAPGDQTAAALLSEGAEWILRAIHALGWRPGERLCLLGGVGPHYADLLGVEITPPEGNALDGALALAAEMGDAPRLSQRQTT